MRRIAILLSLTVVSLLGCNDQTTTANRSTIQIDLKTDPSNREDFQEALVSFHPPSESKIIVRTATSESMVSFDEQNPNSDQPFIVRLSVDRTKLDNAKTEFTTLLRPQTPNGAVAGGPSTEIVDGDVKASEFLAVTIDNGEYPVNEPIELGTLNGEPITLTVTTE